VTSEENTETVNTETDTTQATSEKRAETDWKSYEEHAETTEFLESEYDHKAWLLSSRLKDEEVVKLHNLIQKELSLSFISDPEMALIYSMQMDCVEEWISMNAFDLAKRGLFKMMVKLRLNLSIDGTEIVLQHGTSSITLTGERGTHEREQIQAGEEDEQQGKRKVGISNLFGRIKKMGK
jgi:hypothetical protein